MKLSFATLGCPDWNLGQIAENAARLGFDGVELRGVAGEHIGPQESPADRTRIRTLFEAHGLEIACIMGYSRFTAPDAGQRRENIEAALRFVDVAADIGCPVLRLFGGTIPDGDRARGMNTVIDSLKEVCAKAENAGVAIALETHDDWCKGEQILAVVDGVGSTALGICWDVGNSHFVDPAPVTYAAVKDVVKHVHYKDAITTAEGRQKSVLPGTGEVELDVVMELLHDGGYAGYLSFEWEKKWEPDLEEPDVALPHFLQFTSDMMAKYGVPRG